MREREAIWMVTPGGRARIGHYRMRLTADGPWVRAIVYVSCPIEMAPEYWNPLDRDWRRSGFRVDIDGEPVTDLADRMLIGVPIDAAEYDLMARQAEWDRRHAPDAPSQSPRRPVDTAKMRPFF